MNVNINMNIYEFMGETNRGRLEQGRAGTLVKQCFRQCSVQASIPSKALTFLQLFYISYFLYIIQNRVENINVKV